MPSKLSIASKKPKQFPPNATFPPPQKFLVQDSPTNPRGGLAFFEYWREIAGTKDDPKDRADLVTVRFYLHVPVVMYKLVDPKRTNTVFATVEGPLWFENPEDYETEVPKRFGAARWHVLLNEAGVHGHLMESYFSAGTWDDYPLTIDLRTLVRTEPKNADYIQWLQKNNIKTPWDNPEDEDNMQAGDVLKVVVDGMRETNQLVREKTEELAEVKLAAVEEELERTREEQSDRTDVRLNAQNEGIKLVADTARQMVSMAREDRRQDVNPLEIIRTAVELVRPQQDTGLGIFIEAMKDQNAKMLAMQESNQEFMRSVIGMRKNQDGTWSAPASGTQEQGGFEVEIQRFERLAGVLGWSKPNTQLVQQQQNPEPHREPEKSFWSVIAENPVPVLTAISTIITLGANIIYNLRSEPGKSTSPQEALQKTQPSPAAQPAQQTAANPKDINSWLPFAQHLVNTGCFRAHFLGQDAGLSGYSFAEFLLSDFTGSGPTEKGRRGYNSIKENLGIAGFDKLVRGVPQLFEVVRDTPESYQKFLNEFFTYDEMMEAQQKAAAGAVA